MIKTDMIVTMRCDRCQLKLKNEVGTYWFANTLEAVSEARSRGWKVIKDKTLCPHCKTRKQ